MSEEQHVQREDDWIFGAAIDSEMGVLIRNFDWSKTPLGPLKDWHICMKSALSMCLTSNFAMVLWLGREFLTVYNNAFRQYCGQKHPHYFARPGSEYWHEIWDVIGPMIESVMKTGKATWMTDHLLVSNGFGYTEETYWTYSYSPILSPGGKVHGVFTATEDNTIRYLSERRLRTLRDLSANLANADDTKQVIEVASTTIAQNIYEVPFCVFYLYSSKERRLSLAKAVSIDVGIKEISPTSIDLWQQDAGDNSFIKEAVLELFPSQNQQKPSLLVRDLPSDVVLPPLAPWNDSPRQVAFLALRGGGVTGNESENDATFFGVLVVGINTHRALDERYRDFFSLMASQLSASLATARSYEEERRRAEQLAELDRAKTVFFSNVSHEFRTPLTLMIGPVEELLFNPEVGRGLTEAQKGSLSLVHRNTMRLLKLVNVLLDFSRIEAGRMQASYRVVNLATLTAELASVFRSACEKANLRLLVNCPADALAGHGEIYVDVDMWEKVVLNLLSNAYKYTLAGEIEVRVGLDTTNEQPAALLSVRDTGCGIPEAEMPRIFERFHRIQTSQGRTHEGTGIGLALVYELVRLHGGTIRAESRLNQGSKFLVSIPFGKSHLPQDRIVEGSNSASSGLNSIRTTTTASLASEWWLFGATMTEGSPTSSTGGLLEVNGAATPAAALLPSMSGNILTPSTRSRSTCVLVVDDNVDMRNYVSKILMTAGYVVLQAHDGQEALEMLQQDKNTPLPELVVSDIMMPRLDGIGLLKALRQTPELASLPIMLLSARAGEEARVEGLAAGADDYVAKPFSAKELVARVSARIELSRQYQAAAKREAILRREAEEANAIKDRFLAVLSHELRTPLTPALLLAEDYELNVQISPPIREDMATIGRQIRLQVQMIDDLLDVTKIRQGKFHLRMQQVDAHTLLQQTSQLFTRAMAEKQLPFSLRLTATSTLVLADATRLQQVFWNLIGNAVKFTPDGGSITVETSNDDSRNIIVRISDTGIGIEPSSLGKLFCAFEQIDRDITRSFGGLGLGLAISKSIATLHGGTLEATSEGKNRGASFTLTLPTRRLSPTASPTYSPHGAGSGGVATLSSESSTSSNNPAPQAQQDAGKAEASSQSLRILLVEDNATTVQVMLRLLGRLGHQVTTANSCETALQAIEKSLARGDDHQPQVLLCDLGLPDGSGYDLLPKLRARHPSLRAIALSGFGREEDIQKSYQAGFMLHLTKPIRLIQVEDAISAVMKM